MKLRRISIYVASGILILLLAITFVPTLFARYLIGQELERFGIANQGLDTLEISVWKREVWVGPLKLGNQSDQQAQLGHFGIKVRYVPVFSKRAWVESILIKGLDVSVSHLPEGDWLINGIPLSSLTVNDPDQAPQVEDDVQEEPWLAGLDKLELRDSRLLYTEAEQGQLEAKIDTLELSGFHAWSPTRPGLFKLTGEVNGIQINWNGGATPFDESITLDITAETRSTSLAKIAEFTGPVGLERYDGEYDLDAHHRVTINHNGDVSGVSTGNLKASDLHYQTDDHLIFKSPELNLALDTQYSLTKAGEIQVGGKIETDLEQLDLSLSEDQRLVASALKLTLNEFDLQQGANGELKVKTKPSMQMADGQFDGRFELSVDKVLNLLTLLQSLSAPQDADKQKNQLSTGEGGRFVSPGSHIGTKSFEIGKGDIAFSMHQGRLDLNLQSSSKVSGVTISSMERDIKIEQISTQINQLDMVSNAGNLMLNLSGDQQLINPNLEGPNGRIAMNEMNTAIEKLSLDSSSDGLKLTAVATQRMGQSALTTKPTTELPASKGSIGGILAQLKSAELDMSGDRVNWSAHANLTVDDFDLDVAEGELLKMDFKQFALQDFKADQTLEISLAQCHLDQMQTYFKRGFIENLAGQNSEEASQEPDKTAEADSSSSTDETEKSPVKFALGHFELKNKARIEFHDDQTDPEVKLNTEIESLSLSDVNTADPNQKAKLGMKATINEFTHLNVDGWIQGLASKDKGQLDLNLEALDLPPISPYAAKMAGVHIDSGQLNTQLGTSVNKGQLDGKIDLSLVDLKFAPLSDADAKRIEAKTGIPIETAIGLLQDDNGEINLEMPVSGPAEKPNVDYSDAINQAIGGALKKVFPPTLIASMVKSGAKAGVSFPSVEFEPLSAQVSPQSAEVIGQLTNLLQQRPKLRLKVCGRATGADFKAKLEAERAKIQAGSKDAQTAADDKSTEGSQVSTTAQPSEPTKSPQEQWSPELNQLAVERMQAVRRTMLATKGIDAGRVGECRSTFDHADQGKPRVDVKL